MSTALDTWIDAIRLEEKTCPWAGPRPIQADDPGYFLVGREDDTSRFGQAVEQNKLVVLEGESGVGKTSLLQRALVPRLEKMGFVVAVCRDWKDDPNLTGDDGTLFLARRVHDALAKGSDPTLADRHAPDDSLFETIEEEYGSRFVIVLDQFEELMRVSEHRSNQIISRVLDINKFLQTKVVISLRSEYVHRLRRLDQEARTYSYTYYHLDEVDTEKALRVIRPTEVEDRLTPGAAAAISDLWRAARNAGPAVGDGDGEGTVGLLNLGSLLYALHFRSRDATSREFGMINEDSVAGIVDWRNPRGAFFEAMGVVVDIKLEIGGLGDDEDNEGRVVRDSEISGVDRFLLEGVKSAVRRCAPLLSSGGYKLHRDAGDLAHDVLRNEISSLERGMREITLNRGLVGDIVQRMLNCAESTSDRGIDLLGARWTELMPLFDGIQPAHDLRTSIDTSERALVRGAADPHEVTCGPMMGLSPAAVLLEELRRFTVALLWMRESLLVRFTSPTPSKTVVSLVHDRFGDGLEKWSSSKGDDPHPDLHAITAPQGANFYWKLESGEPHSLLNGQDGGWVIANLRWKGGWVSADFSHLTFANCDLRGTMFAACTFTGVDFVNCLLDGAMFDECRFEGSPAPSLEPSWKLKPSRFIITTEGDSDSYTGAGIARYRCADTYTERWYSGSAGLPLLPEAAREMLGDTEALTEWKRSTGGVSVYGGRISSVTFRGCTFEPDEGAEAFSFRHVGGTGLAFVEQVGPCAVEVHASALRHIVFSAADGAAAVDLRFKVSAAVLLQTWVSPGFTGSIHINNTRLVQFWNAADDVSVALDQECNALGAVGVDVFTPSQDMVLATHAAGVPSVFTEVAQVDPGGEVLKTIDDVDYREAPQERFFVDLEGSEG